MNSIYAVIDVGTNSTRFIVAEISHISETKTSVNILDRGGVITRLGKGVDKTGFISIESMQDTLSVIKKFKEQIISYNPQQIVIFGTSALRDAKNSKDFFSLVEKETELKLQIISGEEEAELVYLASVNSLDFEDDASLIILDIGGGSTELILGNKKKMDSAFSMNIGSVRMTERFLHSDPVNDDEYFTMRDYIHSEVSEFIKSSALAGNLTFNQQEWSTVRNTTPQQPTRTMIGVAGTITTLASIHLGLATYNPSKVHGYVITLENVKNIREMLKSKSIEERKKIIGLEPKRADIIFAGCVILEVIMDLLSFDKLTVSDNGVLYGMVVKMTTS